MIGMLMGDQDGIHGVALFVNGGEAGKKVAFAQAGIHQDAGGAGADEGRVTGTTAGEHTDFDDDAPPKFIVAYRVSREEIRGHDSAGLRLKGAGRLPVMSPDLQISGISGIFFEAEL